MPLNDQTTGVSSILRRLASTTLTLMLIASADTSAGETNSLPSQSERAMVPSFHVQRYQVVGPSSLSQDEVDRAMSEATGSVSLAQIRRSLQKLQQTLRNQGFPKASITLPRQSLTNGIVLLSVVEGPATLSTNATNGLSTLR